MVLFTGSITCRNPRARVQKNTQRRRPHSVSRIPSRVETRHGSRSRSRLAGPVTMWSPHLVLSALTLCALGHGSDDEPFVGQVEITDRLFPEERVQMTGVVPLQRPTRVWQQSPEVLFPLERPGAENLALVCEHLGQRRPYPLGPLPTTGFSHLQRKVDAVGRMEASFGRCCRETEESDRINCLLQGWMQSLDQFCEEEFSTKTRAHKCCREPREERHDCFARVAPLHSYEPPPPPSASTDEPFVGQVEITDRLFPEERVRMTGEALLQRPTRMLQQSPEVLFPLERPGAENLALVCGHLGHRRSYPLGSLPTTGFSHLQRKVDAVGRMEASFGRCCRETEESDRINCMLQGWMLSLDQFCEEEFSTKTRAHKCCREPREERHDCFARVAPLHSYEPPPPPSAPTDEPFVGQVEITDRLFLEERVRMADDVPLQRPTRVLQKSPEVLFPLERPDAENLALVCGHLGQRRSYPLGSLPTTGFSHLQRKADALGRMEASFGRCCRETEGSDRINCMLQGWMLSLDQFCEEEFSTKTRAHKCCREPRAERHDCFARVAPLHSYKPPPPPSVPTGECTAPPRLLFPWLLFPPPQPDRESISDLCQQLMHRHHHHPLGAAPNASRHLDRQAHAIDALVTALRRCCLENEPLPCAQQTWSEVLTSFCREPGEANGASSPCCLKTDRKRDACFNERARRPDHRWESRAISLVAVTECTMQILCQTPLRVAGQGLEKLLVTKLRKKCCKLETMASKVGCGIKEKTHIVNNACGRFIERWTDHLGCCVQDTMSCFDTGYLAHIEVHVNTAS